MLPENLLVRLDALKDRATPGARVLSNSHPLKVLSPLTVVALAYCAHQKDYEGAESAYLEAVDIFYSIGVDKRDPAIAHELGAKIKRMQVRDADMRDCTLSRLHTCGLCSSRLPS